MVSAIVTLVAAGAFGLGRLSVVGGEAPQLVINHSPESLAATAAFDAAPGQAAPLGQGSYVASKSGTKYYLTTCSGVSRIKEENKIYFRSAGEAAAAGYEPAANCPGL